MPKQITTFRGFLVAVVKLVIGLVVIVAVLGGVLVFALKAQGMSISALLPPNLSSLPLSIPPTPSQIMTLMQTMLSTDPTKSLIQMTAFPGFTFAALFSTIIMIWVERKLVAKVQLRVGPQYAGRFEGILQNFADLFKLLFKELVVPDQVDKAIFLSIPLALMFIAGALLSLVPVGPTTFIADPPTGAILVFAIIGLTPLAVMLAGWSSNSKYSLLGALRALHQMVAYEIPMLIAIVGVIILAGSLDMVKIVTAQASIWFIVLQPLGAIAFYICLLAELERVPFDLPEADTELVAGWMTEYGGMTFGIFQLATYIKFYALAGVFTTFYLGGWYGPGPVAAAPVWFILKTFIVMLSMMLIRAVLPRVRIDVLLKGGWTKLMILSFASLLMAILVLSLGLFSIGGL